MTEQQSQNLLPKVDLLSTIQNNKFITQGEKLETVIAKVRVFVSNLLLFVFFCNARRWTACVQQKFESVYLHVIKKHRNNLLFSYYELGFRCFELDLFSHCFDCDLKNLNLSKHFERLTGRTHCLSVIHLI